MSLRKSLTKIVLVGALALSASACSSNPEYHYKGKIGEEKVVFYERVWGLSNSLEVTRSNGIVVEYFDTNNDFKLDYIEITKDEKTIRYNRDVIGKPVIKKGQPQFNEYLAKIIQLKQIKGLSDIDKE